MRIKSRCSASLWRNVPTIKADAIAIFRVRKGDVHHYSTSVAKSAIMEIAQALARKAAREDHARLFGEV